MRSLVGRPRALHRRPEMRRGGGRRIGRQVRVAAVVRVRSVPSKHRGPLDVRRCNKGCVYYKLEDFVIVYTEAISEGPRLTTLSRYMVDRGNRRYTPNFKKHEAGRTVESQNIRTESH